MKFIVFIVNQINKPDINLVNYIRTTKNIIPDYFVGSL